MTHRLFDTLDTFCDYCIARTTQTLVEIPAFFFCRKEEGIPFIRPVYSGENFIKFVISLKNRLKGRRFVEISWRLAKDADDGGDRRDS